MVGDVTSNDDDRGGGPAVTAASSRERLITAARELFWRQGVASTSPRQVMVASGVGQGSLYHHFPAKQDLARVAIQATVREALLPAERELTGESPARERLRQYLVRPRDAIAGCRVGRLAYEQYVIDDDALSEPVRDYFSALIALAQAVFEEMPGVTGTQARDRAFAAVAVLQGGYVLSRALGDPAALSSAVSGFLGMLDGSDA
jgi:AcrR family transcriptional regulator